MGKFVFRLQSILNIKNKLRTALNNLGKAVVECEKQKIFTIKLNRKNKHVYSIRLNQEGISVGIYKNTVDILNFKQ